MVQSTNQIKTCNLNSGELTCRLQTFLTSKLRSAGKTAILLNKKLKGPCRRIKRDKLSGTESKIKRLLKDEKRLETTVKDPTQANSAGKEPTEKGKSLNSTLQIIEGTVRVTFKNFGLDYCSCLHLSVSQVKDQGSDSDAEAEQTARNEPSEQGSTEESENGESDVKNTDGENEEDEDKVTKEELYLLLISFFAILGLTHCAMA